jgi:hypothetical protein
VGIKRIATSVSGRVWASPLGFSAAMAPINQVTPDSGVRRRGQLWPRGLYQSCPRCGPPPRKDAAAPDSRSANGEETPAQNEYFRPS